MWFILVFLCQPEGEGVTVLSTVLPMSVCEKCQFLYSEKTYATNSLMTQVKLNELEKNSSAQFVHSSSCYLLNFSDTV